MKDSFNNGLNILSIKIAAVLGLICIGMVIGMVYLFSISQQTSEVEVSVSENFIPNAEVYNEKNMVAFNEIIQGGTNAAASKTAKVTGIPISGTPAPEEEINNSEFLFPESDTKELTVDDILSKITDAEKCQRAIDEIYARHGYEFQKDQNASEYEYFNSLPWYKNMEKKDENSVVQDFSYTESYNISALNYYKSMMGW